MTQPADITSNGPYAGLVRVTLAGLPTSVTPGASIDARVWVVADASPVFVEGASKPALLLIRDSGGSVVFTYRDLIGGTGLRLPLEPHDRRLIPSYPAQAVDNSRSPDAPTPLPPGTYDVIAEVSSDGNRWRLYSEPYPLAVR